MTSKSETFANEVPSDIHLPDPVTVVVIDTDKYAGNFERELAAYAAGAYDETRYHGEEFYQQFMDEEDNPDYEICQRIADKVTYAHHREYNDVTNTIWPTPGVLNNGVGVALDDNGSNRGSPMYNSVAIFFEEPLTPEELAVVKARAIEYGQGRTDWYGHSQPVEILGIRQLNFNVVRQQVPAVEDDFVEVEDDSPPAATQTVYGLTVDHGDGSSGIRWFKNRHIVESILEDDEYIEEYYGNEGTPSIVLTFPASLDLKACGFRFHDA